MPFPQPTQKLAVLMPTNEQNEKAQLCRDIGVFLNDLPASAGMETIKDPNFLFHFEATRLLIVRDLLLACGVKRDEAMDVLDFGYLHGVFQEFIHRFFPKARFQVCDRPDSPIFSDPAYQNLIRQRTYLTLNPRDITNLDGLAGQYRVILLGEIIEHLDPSRVLEVFQKLRKSILPGGVLVVTTPNGAGLYNCLMTLQDNARIQDAPIPDPLVGMGHIHLWPSRLLRQTAEYSGWTFKDTRYYHGREAEMFADVRRRWVSLKTQLLMRGIEFMANRVPRYRGFYVSTFIAG